MESGTRRRLASAIGGEFVTSSLVEVVPHVWVATSRRYASNSTAVRGDGDVALVIDPNWDADEIAAIPHDLRQLGLTCGLGLATHVHYDHVLWHPDLGDHPRYSSRWTVHACDHHRDEILAPLVGDLSPELIDLAGRLVPIPGTRDPLTVPSSRWQGERTRLPEPVVFPWGSREVLLHEHDAHASAHLAVEFVDHRVLVAGDMCSDLELPMPDEDNPDLSAYLQGLDYLADVARRCDVVIPGHGSPGRRPLERIDADRRYLDDLLTRGDSDDPRVTYPDNVELHAANQRRARGM